MSPGRRDTNAGLIETRSLALDIRIDWFDRHGRHKWLSSILKERASHLTLSMRWICLLLKGPRRADAAQEKGERKGSMDNSEAKCRSDEKCIRIPSLQGCEKAFEISKPADGKKKIDAVGKIIVEVDADRDARLFWWGGSGGEIGG